MEMVGDRDRYLKEDGEKRDKAMYKEKLKIVTSAPIYSIGALLPPALIGDADQTCCPNNLKIIFQGIFSHSVRQY